MAPREVLFEGLRAEEILKLPRQTIEQLILIGEPLVFPVGAAVIPGSIKLDSTRLIIELAQIEGAAKVC